MIKKNDLKKVSDYIWEIPKDYRSDMRVPARFYSSEEMLEEFLGDRSLDQLVNVATLRGIQKYALAMPDIHEGYGFPIGGVAAFDVENGIISPGGIGYDLNCGIRLLRSLEKYDDVKGHLNELGRKLFKEIPSGVGRSGRLDLGHAELDSILSGGASKIVEMGYGEKDDLEHLESGGILSEADSSLVSDQAKDRGRDQLGTMGAGNHFVEVQRVETIYNEAEAKKMGLFENQVVVMIHMGSRGLGHQIATDYIRVMMKAMLRYGITLPDRELACAPFKSKEGQDYFAAMSAGANFAWANRQMITWEVRKAWVETFGQAGGRLNVVYDVAHNIAKVEDHIIDGRRKKVVVHRKGATRSFPDQPVLIPGSMGTASYVLVGSPGAMAESFGSSCHGAGRRMSRHEAKNKIRGAELKRELEQRGVVINAGSMSGIAEEAPEAYKDVDQVVEVVHRVGLAKKVARLVPVIVVKG